ncbi:MAG: helix-turn-helix transcriptional regulator [Nitrospira defluvii]|nr:helix-turn-helix transcriptional regulator [Nitrospira defluvii]
MKTHRQYIKERIEKKPAFAQDLAEAEREVTIAVELAQLREQRGLSQSQLARMTGMKQPQIARLESGAYMPAFGTLIRVLEALKGKLELSQTECRVTPTSGKVACLR